MEKSLKASAIVYFMEPTKTWESQNINRGYTGGGMLWRCFLCNKTLYTFPAVVQCRMGGIHNEKNPLATTGVIASGFEQRREVLSP